MEDGGLGGGSRPPRRSSLLQTLGDKQNGGHHVTSTVVEDDGQDIAEYAVMLAVILVLVIGTVRLIGGNANNAFSSVANNLQ